MKWFSHPPEDSYRRLLPLTCRSFIFSLLCLCLCVDQCAAALWRTRGLNLKDVAVCSSQGAPGHVEHADCGFDEQHCFWGGWFICDGAQVISVSPCFLARGRFQLSVTCPHLSPGTTGPCSRPGSSSSSGSHHGHSRCRAWSPRRWSSVRPWLRACRHTGRHSGVPGSAAGTRCRPAPLDPGCASS